MPGGRHPGPSPSSCGASTLTPPAFARASGDGFHAIIGGYVVRDAGLPTLNGRYLYGDAALSNLRSVALPDTGDRIEALPVSRASSFGEDACGRIYVASLDGPVYRIQDGAPTPCTYPAPTATTPAPADAAAPSLRVRILRASLRHRRLRFAVTCNEACRIAIGTAGCVACAS